MELKEPSALKNQNTGKMYKTMVFRYLSVGNISLIFMQIETNAVNLMIQLSVWQEFPGCSTGRQCSERELSSFLKLGSQTLKFDNVKAARICRGEYQRGRELGRCVWGG